MRKGFPHTPASQVALLSSRSAPDVSRVFSTVALVALAIVSGLLGCEASLDLRKVEAERSEATVRTDQFQAAEGDAHVTIVAGSHGIVLTSRDGAATWQRAVLPNRPPLIDLAGCSNGTWLALSFDRAIWVSTDHAATWSRRALPSEETPVAVACDSDGDYWVVGSFSLVLTSADGGRTWRDLSFPEDQTLTSIHFLIDETAIITAEFGGLYRSDDGGETWALGDPIPNEFYPQASLFLDADHGWVAGLQGTILRTKDGGRSWQREVTDTQAPLYDLRTLGSRYVAVGDYGTVLTSNGDGKWNSAPVPMETSAFLAASLPLIDGNLLIVGGNGTVEHAPRKALMGSPHHGSEGS